MKFNSIEFIETESIKKYHVTVLQLYKPLPSY